MNVRKERQKTKAHKTCKKRNTRKARKKGMHVRSKGTQAWKPYRAREARNLAHSPLIRLVYKLESYQMQPAQNIKKKSSIR